MSLLSILIYIVQGTHLRRGYSKKCPEDAVLLELFSRILVGRLECSHDQLSSDLEASLPWTWEGVYDQVNPFGDPRGRIFKGVWIFDLENDLLLWRTNDQLSSITLSLARKRLLALDDFEPLSSPPLTFLKEQSLPEPYWRPDIIPDPRLRSFLVRILRDFTYTWRHVLRGQMNSNTFLRLAYAIIWLSDLNFTILERTGFEHVSDGGSYVHVVDLPNWKTPEHTLVRAGSSWFALAQDLREGLKMVQDHTKGRRLHENTTDDVSTYVILTLQEVSLCNFSNDRLRWTQPEILFDVDRLSSKGVDMILWAIHGICAQPETNAISLLPIEIQDRILYHASTSVVAASKLGCELGLGSPCSWVDVGAKIRVQEAKRHRSENSPVESQIVLHGVMSGVSYKRERGYERVLHGRGHISRQVRP